MARPYSKKTRAQAALLAEVTASNYETRFADMEQALGIPVDDSPRKLMFACLDAYNEVRLAQDRLSEGIEGLYAHAALLLRQGWSPGDPIELLPEAPVLERVGKVLNDPSLVVTNVDAEAGTVTIEQVAAESAEEVRVHAETVEALAPENATGAADAMTPEGPGEYDPEEEAYAEGRRRDAEAFADAEEDDELDRVTDPEPEEETNLFDTSDAEDYDEEVDDHETPDPYDNDEDN